VLSFVKALRLITCDVGIKSYTTTLVVLPFLILIELFWFKFKEYIIKSCLDVDGNLSTRIVESIDDCINWMSLSYLVFDG
jgi:hypothetical protein